MADRESDQGLLLPECFGGSRSLPQATAAFTPARLAISRAGNRPGWTAWLRFREDHAAARDAVWGGLDEDWPHSHALLPLASQAATKQEYLLRPDLGARLDAPSEARLRAGLAADPAGAGADLQLVVGDGLSAEAVAVQAPVLLEAIGAEASARRWSRAPSVFVRHARVAVMDEVAEITRPKVCAILIGERPGLLSSVSLSLYVAWRAGRGTTHADRNCLSNIHAAGTSPEVAARLFVRLVEAMNSQQLSGVRLLLPR